MSTKIGLELYGSDHVPTSQPSLAERILTMPVRHEDVTRPVELLDAVRHDLALELDADVRLRWLEPQQDLAS